jgi:branched-chain amino acid transport system permease protein
LAFGEIFRLAMFNLDGNNGPNLTHGPNGIPGIPELNLFGFNFGETHTIAGHPADPVRQLLLLLLLLIAFIIRVHPAQQQPHRARLGGHPRGRAAAEAMGVNVFGLKLLAFAGGAFLAGLAGTIKAHQDTAVSPDQYIFLESAFLLGRRRPRRHGHRGRRPRRSHLAQAAPREAALLQSTTGCSCSACCSCS